MHSESEGALEECFKKTIPFLKKKKKTLSHVARFAKLSVNSVEENDHRDVLERVGRSHRDLVNEDLVVQREQRGTGRKESADVDRGSQPRALEGRGR